VTLHQELAALMTKTPPGVDTAAREIEAVAARR
jgi:hypothetical protein